MKPAEIGVVIVLGLYLAFKWGKEVAYEELREAMGLEDVNFEDAQRANAGMQ